MRYFLCFLFFSLTTVFQISAQTLHIANPTITVEKWQGLPLTIPVTIKVNNNTAASLTSNITLALTNNAPITAEQLAVADFPLKTPVRNATIPVMLAANSEKSYTFYIVVEKTLDHGARKSLPGTITLGGVSQSITIQIDPAKDQVFLLDDYLANEKLVPLIKVESVNNTLSLYGYRNGSFQKRSVLLEKNQVLAVNEWSWAGNSFHWSPFPLSIITVPVKVRPALTSAGIPFTTSATAGLTNLGLNVDLVKYQRERYFATGKKSTHKFSFGLWVAPNVEEMDSVFTNGTLGKAPGKLEKSKQFLISTGFTFSYSYNDISFVLVPLGWDIPTSPLGHKWVYGGKWWWGFGIGISPKIFSTILNK